MRAGPNYADPGQPARFARQAEQRAFHTAKGGENNGYGARYRQEYRQLQNLASARRYLPDDILEIDTYNRIERVLEQVQALRYAK